MTAPGDSEHLCNEACIGALLSRSHAAGLISGEGAHSHLVHDDVLWWQVWPFVVLAPVKWSGVQLKGASELAARLWVNKEFRLIKIRHEG